jgi:hypothetical protein
MIYAVKLFQQSFPLREEVKNELEILEKSRRGVPSQTQGTAIGSGKIPGGEPAI